MLGTFFRSIVVASAFFLASLGNAQEGEFENVRTAISALKNQETSTAFQGILENLKAGKATEARKQIIELAEKPEFPIWLSDGVEKQGTAFAKEVLLAVGRSFSEDEREFRDGGNGVAVIEAMAKSPRCLWTVYQQLPSFDWGNRQLAEQILDHFDSILLREQPERAYEFLRFSPLVKNIPDFNPGPDSQFYEKSLLERLLVRFRTSKSQSEILTSLLRQNKEPGFGAQLIISYLKDPANSDVNLALFFNSKLDDVEYSGEVMERRLLAMATRLAGRVAKTDQDELYEFQNWLAIYNVTSSSLDRVDEWMAAKTWEELGVHEHPSIYFKEFIKLLKVLIPIDKEKAYEFLFHVSDLRKQTTEPEKYANWKHSFAESLLIMLLRETSHPVEYRAFCLNAFVRSEGKVGLAFAENLETRMSYYLVEILYARMQLDDRFTGFFKRLRITAEGLDPDSVPLLIQGFRGLAARIPFNDVRVDEVLRRLELEKAKPSTDLELAVFAQLENALKMRNQNLKKEHPRDGNDFDSSYVKAIQNPEKSLSWRYALCCSLMIPDHGKRSNELALESLKTLMEVYGEEVTHVVSVHEENIFRAAHLQLILPKHNALFTDYIAAWEKRFVGGESSSHRNEHLARMIQVALQLENQVFAYKVVNSWENVQNEPLMLIAALNGGSVDLAKKLFDTREASYIKAPVEIRRSVLFDKTAKEFLKVIIDSENLQTDPLHLKARVLLHLAPGGKFDAQQQDAREIAIDLGKSMIEYESREYSPKSLETTILLMTQIPRPPGELDVPVSKWIATQEIDVLLAKPPNESAPFVKTLLFHAQRELSAANGRRTDGILKLIENALDASSITNRSQNGSNPTWSWSQARNKFLDDLFHRSVSSFRDSVHKDEGALTEKLDDWITLFKKFSEIPKSKWSTTSRGGEVYNLVAACGLAKRCEELTPWLKALPPEHQTYLVSVTSTGLDNVLRATAVMAKRAPSLRDNPERRRDLAAEILKSPFPSRGTNFTHEWPHRGMATKAELLSWSEKLTEGASGRRGATALNLARLARDLKQPQKALELIEQALQAKPLYNFDLVICTLEKANIFVAMGKKPEAITMVEALSKTPKLSEDLTRRCAEALRKLNED